VLQLCGDGGGGAGGLGGSGSGDQACGQTLLDASLIGSAHGSSGTPALFVTVTIGQFA
jgi:hypothetical protein